MQIREETLWELIESRAAATPNALLSLDEFDRRLSFGEYREACLSAACGFAERGIQPGQAVSWLLPTRHEALILIGALARLGARQNPILPIYREREVGFITRQSSARLLVLPSEFRGFNYKKMGSQLVEEEPELEMLVVDDSLPDAHGHPLPDFSELKSTLQSDPIRWLFYTSGTTSNPKGALHSDAGLLAFSAGMAEVLDLREDDRIAMVFPITHIGGAGWLIAGLMSGAAQICTSIFSPDTTVELLDRHGVTQATAGTAFHQVYLEAQREAGERRLFPDVRTFPGGGAPKPPALHDEIKRAFGGAGIISGYGLTECPIITMNRVTDPDEKLAHSEGRVNPCGVEVRIVSPEGRIQGSGQEGEILAKGPQLCLGYLDSALDEKAFDAEGFFRTGDLGSLDPDGFLTITGRLKDIIIRKGENISAKEVEDELHSHPGVADVAVIGLPDPDSGERCCAVVVPRDSKKPPSLEEISLFLRERSLMIQKIPEQLEVIAELPRNATGKVLKFELRDRYSES